MAATLYEPPAAATTKQQCAAGRQQRPGGRLRGNGQVSESDIAVIASHIIKNIDSSNRPGIGTSPIGGGDAIRHAGAVSGAAGQRKGKLKRILIFPAEAGALLYDSSVGVSVNAVAGGPRKGDE